MDEAVLHRQIGSPDVMRNQIDHLIQMAERETISVQVVPRTASSYPGLAGPFTIITREAADAVHVTGAGLGPIIDIPEQVEKYRLRFDLIRGFALSTEESFNLVRNTLESA
jgi:hypothetical protein